MIFAGLTAWDTQSIKENYYAGDAYEMTQKKSIYGALGSTWTSSTCSR